VFLRRCAWHRKYYGYTKILGVATWSGLGVSFTDGMCTSCANRVRAEFRKPILNAAPVTRTLRSLRPDFALAAAVVMLAVTITFGLVSGPTPYESATPSAPGPIASVDPPAPVAPAVTAPAARATPVPPETRGPAPGGVAGTPAATPDAVRADAPAVPVVRARAARGSGVGGGRGRIVAYRPVKASAALAPLVLEDEAPRPLDPSVSLAAVSDPGIQAP
jgi:hypothetical protein